MPKAVFVRANSDMVTEYLSTYAVKLLDFAKTNGYETVDLYDNDAKLPARLPTFETEMEKKPIDLFIGLGHGGKSLFTGQDLEVLIKQGVNDDVCKDTKCYLFSCLTAQQLGPAMVEKGCPQYFGYKENWTFIYNPDFEQTPLEDPYARAFFDAGLATGYALILGKTPQEVYQLTIDRYNFWWDYWMKSEDPMADDILTWLNWDKRNFVGLIPGETAMVEPAAAGLEIPSFVLPLGAAGLLLFLLSRA